MSARPLLFGGLALLLVAAVALVAYGGTRPVERTFHSRLVDLLPPAPAGWTRTLRPIADTPEMQKAVGELLNYDDGVFADYTRGADRLSVYIAYWTPGRMSHRLVAGHTPDVCWVGAGWTCTERGEVRYQLSAVRPQASDVGRQSSALPPAESRTFTLNQTTEYVWFWHLVGGAPKSYGTGREAPWHAPLTDLLAKGLRQREEQFFIRLSAPTPLDEPALQPLLAPVLHALPLPDAGGRL